MRRYHDAQAKCPLADGNGVIDFYFNETAPIDTENCYGYFQATYTSDAGMTNISHLPIDYLVDFAGNIDTVSHSGLPSPLSCCPAVVCGATCLRLNNI